MHKLAGNQTPANNSVIEKYCYNNSPAYCALYGGLYLWDEAMQYSKTEGAQGICPIGWRLPKYTDLQILGSYVNGNGNLLKAIGQGSGNGSGTNVSGFSFLLSGNRAGDGSFYGLNFLGNIWATTQSGSSNAYGLSLAGDVSAIDYHQGRKDDAYSVRCIKDSGTVGVFNDKPLDLPNSINVKQNYPNPFNPSTTISFSLPEKAKIVIIIYNEMGAKIAEIFSGEQSAGEHDIIWNAGTEVSGVYFCEFKTEKYRIVRKLLLIK
ncbi:MAG: T9SS type A sorting domain-containing protein [Ignavibacteriales bacterium]|nr:T9SS type A sorting domain-containing protein [Ignavibacteriales bacterium]